MCLLQKNLRFPPKFNHFFTRLDVLMYKLSDWKMDQEF